jgi:hypothetical protein
MMPVQDMLRSNPRMQPSPEMSACIELCMECSEVCSACADACLGEEHVMALIRCIRLNLDCAAICDVTARTLTRQVEFDWNLARPMVEACADACRICGAECQLHASMHEHCRICAEVCRQCESACRRLLASMT